MRLLYYIMAWVVAATTLTACFGTDGDEADKATSAKAMRVAIVEVDECLPLVVAEHLGLLDSLHADVMLIRKGSIAECKQAVENGDADACVNDSAIAYRLITARKARIKRISQLGDKVIAADREGCSYNLAREAVDSLLSRGQHVFIIQVEDLRVRLKMLLAGSVDAAVLPEPYASWALKQGGRELKAYPQPLPEGLSDARMRYACQSKKGEGNVSIFNFSLGSAAVTKRKARLKGPSIAARLSEPLRIAEDSIRRYGRENYERTWK